MKVELTSDWRQLFGPSNSREDSRFFAEVTWESNCKPPTFIMGLPEQEW